MTKPGVVDKSLLETPEAAPPRPELRPGEVTAGLLVPVEQAGLPSLAPLPRRTGRYWRWTFGLLAAFLLLVAGSEAVDFVRDLLGRNVWIGGFAAGLAAALGLAALLAVGRDVRALRELEGVDAFRAAVAAAVAADSPRRLRHALDPVVARIGDVRPELAAAYRRATEGEDGPERLLRAFEREILQPLDREADAIIRRGALATGAAAAASPHPALDAAVVLWRSGAMVKRIAMLYGFRPAGVASFWLMRQAVLSAGLAGGADITAETVSHWFADSLAGALSAKLGEATVSGVRAARLGIRTKALCRPLPIQREG